MRVRFAGLFRCSLAIYNGADAQQAQRNFDSFLVDARSQVNGIVFNKEVLNRSKMRVENEQKALLNPIRPNHNLEAVRMAFAAAAPATGWPTYLMTVFGEEEARLAHGLNGNARDFVQFFPSKSYFSLAAKHLQFVPDKMVEILCKALKLTDSEAVREQQLKALRDAIVPVLEPLLWPRSI